VAVLHLCDVLPQKSRKFQIVTAFLSFLCSADYSATPIDCAGRTHKNYPILNSILLYVHSQILYLDMMLSSLFVAFAAFTSSVFSAPLASRQLADLDLVVLQFALTVGPSEK
jgi:hypothetical protein